MVPNRYIDMVKDVFDGVVISVIITRDETNNFQILEVLPNGSA